MLDFSSISHSCLYLRSVTAAVVSALLIVAATSALVTPAPKPLDLSLDWTARQSHRPTELVAAHSLAHVAMPAPRVGSVADAGELAGVADSRAGSVVVEDVHRVAGSVAGWHYSAQRGDWSDWSGRLAEVRQRASQTDRH